MYCVLAASIVDCGFESHSGQIKVYRIIYLLFLRLKHAALRGKSKDWLARNLDNVRLEPHVCLPTDFYFSELAL